MVTLHDGVPVPKVIDFGIAKTTQQELTDKTIHTLFQQFISRAGVALLKRMEDAGDVAHAASPDINKLRGVEQRPAEVRQAVFPRPL